MPQNPTFSTDGSIEARFNASSLLRAEKLLDSLTIVGLLGVSGLIFSGFQILGNFSIIVGSLLALAGLLPLSILINYILKSPDETAIFNNKDACLTIAGKESTVKVEYKDITRVEVFSFTEDLGRYHFNFHFTKYFLPENKILIVSDLMMPDVIVPNHLEPIFIEKLFPYINTSPQEWPKKESEEDKLYRQYKAYSNEKLKEIVSSRGYRKPAKAAAKAILRSREKTTSIR